MPPLSEISVGTLDFFYLLKRRRISFQRWCQTEGIKTREDFFKVKTRIEEAGEYFIPQEMINLGFGLPQGQQILLQGIKPAEKGRVPTIPPPASPEPSEAQEDHKPAKNTKKEVPTPTPE